jgi:hypothetical protein
MDAKIVIGFASTILSLALALGIAPTASATVTTNGNNVGSTDVGVAYAQVFTLNGSSWGNPSINNLPLVDWTALASPSTALWGTFKPYDSSDSTVIDNDLTALAAAKIDFVVFDLTNETAGCIAALGVNNGTTCNGDAYTVAAANVATAIKNWNANNGNPMGSSTWKFRYAIAIGFGDGFTASNMEAKIEAVNSGFVTNSTFGGASNYYQINSQPLVVPTSGPQTYFPGAWTSYCSANPTATGCTSFYIGWGLCQGAGQWSWQLPYPGVTQFDNVDTSIDPNLVEEVMPGWQDYQTGQFVAKWVPRQDGAAYDNNWDVVFNSSAAPRIVMLVGYDDWWENTGVFYNDTATIRNPPSPAYDPYSPPPAGSDPWNGRWPESWTLPDENITLAGYWDYTKAAISYLRSGGTKPSLPQPAPNLAVTATATASTCAGGVGCTSGGWQQSNVNDGNPGTGWSSSAVSGQYGPETITLSWGTTPQTFNTVVLMGRGDSPYCFPVNFEIWADISGTWTKLVQEANFPQPTIPGQPIAFTWGSSVTATAVQVKVTQMSQDTFHNYYAQLGEFEVFNESSTATAPFFANWGFEQPAQGTTAGPYYYQSGAMTYGWTFNSSSAGVEMNCCAPNGPGNENPTTAWGAPQAPQGVQAAFLQNTGSISQTINFPAGTYRIRFLAAQRPIATGQGQQGIKAYIDSPTNTLGTWNPVDQSGNFVPYVTDSFTVSAGLHTITFAGTEYTGGTSPDDTAFIDEVQILNTTSIGSNLLADPSWSSGSLGSYWNVSSCCGGSNSDAYLTTGGGFNGDPYVLNEDATSGSFNVAVYQDNPATAGHTFTASVYAQTSSTTSGAYIAVQDSSPPYTYLCASPGYTSIPAGESTWSMFSCTGTVPTSGGLRFILSSGTNSANGWSKFDNAALYVN